MKKVEIADKELTEHLSSILPDEMAVFVMADGRIRGAIFNGSNFVNQLRAQHGLGILETMVLGQACLGGAMMIPMMKGEEHVTVRYETDGPAKGFSVEADSKGTVRGYLFNERIPVDKPLENWNLKPFLGTGTMTVSTLHKEDREPFVSSVTVDSGNIAEDLAWYYRQSEQISTAFSTSIQMDKKGRVVGAGGMFLQVMPDTGGKRSSGAAKSSSSDVKSDDELLSRAELAFKTCPSLGQWFSEKGNFEDLIYGLFREFKPSIALKRKVRYDCPCNEESFLNYLRSLPKAEVEDIKKNGPDPLEITCRNCGSVYKISTEAI
ncbi:MAG: Hsp33 family molecular chaperone HslO [Treponema sp.]|nr:Hsp33 family molecular chaperone HslO [Treponema sp.]